MPKDLEKLLKEETTAIRMRIPQSIDDVVSSFQKAHKIKTGKFISKHNAIVQILALGLPKMKDQIKEMKKELIKEI